LEAFAAILTKFQQKYAFGGNSQNPNFGVFQQNKPKVTNVTVAVFCNYGREAVICYGSEMLELLSESGHLAFIFCVLPSEDTDETRSIYFTHYTQENQHKQGNKTSHSVYGF